MKTFYTTFKVEGRNTSRLADSLKKRKFTLFDVKKGGEKSLYFTVQKKDAKKVFAISRELCYNIKKVKDGGFFYPFFLLFKNVGVMVGIILAVFLIVFSNDFIFSLSFSGSGAVYSQEVTRFLEQKGVNSFSRFSQIDLDRLGDEILENNPKLSFVSCKKQGNVLQIDMATLNSASSRFTGNVQTLVCDVNGVVESVKVYRGRTLKSVGESVCIGDVLADGLVTIKEQELKVNVIATYSIKAEYYYEYYSKNDNEEDIALIMAENSFSQEIIEHKIQKIFENEQYCYKVTLYFRRVLYAG